MSLFAVSDHVATWMTTLWVIGLGALGAVALLAILWAAAFGVSLIPATGVRFRRFVNEIPLAVREGVLFPFTIILCIFATLGIAGGPFAKNGREILQSLSRLPFVGSRSYEFDVEPPQEAERVDLTKESSLREQEIKIPKHKDAISRIEFESNELVTVSAVRYSDITRELAVEVKPDATLVLSSRSRSLNPMFDGENDTLLVRNKGVGAGKLVITITTTPRHSQVWTVPIMAALMASVYLLYIAQRTFFPRFSAIALSTYKSNVAQGVFLIIIIAGSILCLLFNFIPYNTFGEDIKMVQETGITLIRVLAIGLAIWCASTSVADEIEGRTALTVLSKPIGRRSFVLGKYFGIFWTTALLFVIVGAIFIIPLAYKPIYDGTENSTGVPIWQVCHFEALAIIPGLFLAFLEVMILTAVSVAISTRLPMMVNFVVCFIIYVLGHLTPQIVQSSAEGFDLVKFFAQFIAVVVPNLQNFDVQAAITSGNGIPISYLLWATTYSVVYSLVAMFLALLMFEDRDLT